jgi:hypothetical protein
MEEIRDERTNKIQTLITQIHPLDKLQMVLLCLVIGLVSSFLTFKLVVV